MIKKLISSLFSYRLELTAATTGASVMAIELIGARLIAPYLGSSIYVWTAIIGVILGALSLGFIIGGRAADRNASLDRVTSIIILAGICFLASLRLQTNVLDDITLLPVDVRIQAFLAALILFAPASFFVGMVSPYLAKLRVASLEQVGRTMGRLEAAGAVGSIVGTFLTGYWLMGLLGTQALGSVVVICLLLVTFMLSATGKLAIRVGVLALAVATMAAHPTPTVPYRLIIEVDTSYSKYRIAEGFMNGRLARLLVNDPQGTQSGIYVHQPDEPAFVYNQRFLEVATNMRSPKRFLIIGGGSYTFPQILAHRYPKAQVDVVEIDPALAGIAKQYFAFTSPTNLRIITADGRSFINQAQGQYDAIYVDAFSAIVPPFQLTTTEAVARLKGLTAPNGVVAVNVIAPSRPGKARAFLDAELLSYRTAYSQVAAYETAPEADETAAQNMLLLASDSRDAGKLTSLPAVPAIAANSKATILTDDYAPIEQLTR